MIIKDTGFQKGEFGNRKEHPKGAEGLPPIDLAIFDEAHKTTGRAGGMFSYALDDEKIRINKRLFLTATPRRTDIRKRDKEGEFRVQSMDDESLYGPRAHILSFGGRR